MSWKEERIEKYGEEAYERMLEQKRQRRKANPGKTADSSREWRKANPEKAEMIHRDQCRKGGKRYLKRLKYECTGLPGKRNRVRRKHRQVWIKYKKIIAPGSQIHHEWIPETANYKGVALVEKDQHMHGIIDVIRILSGKITVLTEEEIQVQEHAK